MNRLNPFAKTQAAAFEKAKKERNAKRQQKIKEKRSKAGKKSKGKRNTTYQDLQNGLKQSFKDAEKVIEDEEIAGNYVPGETSEEEEDDE
jgi:hypothetical protein